MSRLKPRVAFLLLALWAPETSWVLGLVAVADGSHHVSLRSSRGDLDLVLHHHAVPPAVDDALDADDHPHGDHVIHGPGHGVLATRLGHVGPLPLCAHGKVGAVGVVSGGTAVHTAVPSWFGLSPPLRTVVLRI